MNAITRMFNVYRKIIQAKEEYPLLDDLRTEVNKLFPELEVYSMGIRFFSFKVKGEKYHSETAHVPTWFLLYLLEREKENEKH